MATHKKFWLHLYHDGTLGSTLLHLAESPSLKFMNVSFCKTTKDLSAGNPQIFQLAHLILPIPYAQSSRFSWYNRDLQHPRFL